MIFTSGSEIAFLAARWFTRGWTLQELLAPPFITFFDKDWNTLGTKWTLQNKISRATLIAEEHLWHPVRARVAVTMSWASKRTTSLPEDRAYSLMGLFNVNMPLLYGEGEKAFVRLQEEIIRNSSDDSIFAWKSDGSEISGILATSPNPFESSGDVIFLPPKVTKRKPYYMTNRGLAIEVNSTKYASPEVINILETKRYGFPEVLSLQLSSFFSSDNRKCCTIYVAGHSIKDQFFRVLCQKLCVEEMGPIEGVETIHIFKHMGYVDNFKSEVIPTAIRFDPHFKRRFLVSITPASDLSGAECRWIDQSTAIIDKPGDIFVSQIPRLPLRFEVLPTPVSLSLRSLGDLS